MQHVVGRLLGGVADDRDVAQGDGAVLPDADDNIAHVFGVPQERAGLEQNLRIGEGPGAVLMRLVGGGDGLAHAIRGETAGGKGGRIEGDPHRATNAANERGLCHLIDGLDGLIELGRESTKRQMILRLAVQGEGENGHVINRAGFDQRLADPGRDAVEVGLQFLVQSDERGLDVGADDKPHNNHGTAGGGRRVEVFHIGNFPQEFFHGPGDAVFHLGGGRAGHAHEDVDHGHLDLRLLLARKLEHGEQAEEDRSNDRDGRKLGIDEHRGQAAAHAIAWRRGRGIGGSAHRVRMISGLRVDRRAERRAVGRR